MIEYLLAFTIGFLLGIIAGLIPGLHINNFLPIIFLFSGFIDPIQFIIIIASMVSSQLIFNFLISIFLGAADDDKNSLAALPSHKLVLKGRGMEALLSLIYGCTIGFLISVSIFFLTKDYFQIFYKKSREIVSFLLIFSIVYLILLERERKKIFYATLIFLISGLFGTISLNMNINSEIALFPILTGLFGISGILVSVSQNVRIPEQKNIKNLNIKNSKILKASFIGSLAGILAGILPGIGTSQSLIIASSLFNIKNYSEFLISLGSVSISDNVFSTVSLYLVGNPRSGASVYLEKVLEEITFKDVLLIFSIFGISMAISIIILLKISQKIFKIISSIDYKTLNISIISLLIFLVFAFSGFIGLFLLTIATMIGVLNIRLNVNRSFSMGVLILPTLLFFLNITL